MYPSALTELSQFIVSECSIKQFSNNLFENKVLKKHYQCLIKPDDVNLSNYRKQLNSIVLFNHLPGYMYSMSDQCRWATNDSKSYACNNYGFKEPLCQGFACTSEGTCSKGVAALDGTSCGRNKICLFNQCVHLKGGSNGNIICNIALKNVFKELFKQF